MTVITVNHYTVITLQTLNMNKMMEQGNSSLEGAKNHFSQDVGEDGCV